MVSQLFSAPKKLFSVWDAAKIGKIMGMEERIFDFFVGVATMVLVFFFQKYRTCHRKATSRRLPRGSSAMSER